jgi:hypothetical protein
MSENIEKPPVVTGLATYTPDRIQAMSLLDTSRSGVGRGIEFGVGRGTKPISNFPGDQMLVRPFTQSGGKMERITPDKLMRTLQEHKAGDPKGIPTTITSFSGQGNTSTTEHTPGISRVTINTGLGTDVFAMKDVLQGLYALRTSTKDSVLEIVISSADPLKLRELREVGLNADVWQQRLRVDPYVVTSYTRRLLGGRSLLDGTEISFPLVETPVGISDSGAAEAAESLAAFGHDSHLESVSTQWEVRRAISAMQIANYGLSRGVNPHRMRGFFVEGNPSRFGTLL